MINKEKRVGIALRCLAITAAVLGLMLTRGFVMAEPSSTEDDYEYNASAVEQVVSASEDSGELSVGDFVDRLYEMALGRNPDEQGRESWVNALTDGGDHTDAARVAWGFIGSQEYVEKGRSNEEYLEDLYRMFLGRESDSDGKSAWLRIANTGVSRKYLANKFAKSEEFSEICRQYGVERGSIVLTELRDLHQKAAALVTAHYEACLGRIPSAQEINEWVVKIVEGYASDLVYGVFHSSEYTAKENSDVQFVNSLYNAILMRDADAGSQGWIGKLERGASRDSVIDGFLQSSEFESICESAGIVAKKKLDFSKAIAFLDKTGWSLRDAFNKISAMKHIGDASINPITPETGIEWFADYGFAHNCGNCFVKSAMLYQIATVLGYDACQAYGQIPRSNGRSWVHSWVEINFDGNTYVVDPSSPKYFFTYGTRGTWIYVKEGEVPM